jgi:hypothetical protein
MMLSKRLLAALLVGMLTVMALGCEREGPAERAGERVDETVDRAGERVEEGGDRVRQ